MNQNAMALFLACRKTEFGLESPPTADREERIPACSGQLLSALPGWGQLMMKPNDLLSARSAEGLESPSASSNPQRM